MMTLAGASSYFDRTAVIAPDTGKVLFMAQMDPYDDSKRDSSAAYRRILSVRPGTFIPTTNVVKMLDRIWIVGASEPDGMRDLHREKYVVQLASVQAKISRLPDFLSGTVSSTVWSAPQWVKDAKQLEVSSGSPQMFDVALPYGSDVRVHDVLWATDKAFLVLSPHRQASGILVANCIKLDQVLPETATLVTRVYSPTAGTYTNSAPADVQALLVRWQSLFQYGSQKSERYQEGDVSIVLPAGTTVATDTLVTLSGVVYQTLAALDLSGAVVLHARVA